MGLGAVGLATAMAAAVMLQLSSRVKGRVAYRSGGAEHAACEQQHPHAVLCLGV